MIRFEFDSKRLMSDPLDGEVIVMDTLSGQLFLMEQAAAVLWDSILRGETREQIIATIRSRYDAVHLAAAEDCMRRLIEFGLVTEKVVEDEASSIEPSGHWPASLGEFLVTKYDDMTSIITMDPIHEVDPQRGWPFEGRN